MTITVKCGVCQKVLATAEGPKLTDDDIVTYQETVSCDDDGQTDIVVNST